ncbi:hypothetical protein DP57_6341 [Burkholderia pseudomallei]|uniref:hypothetical protein n=1 Tax=Burkholderia pseudomallei TaxID=28450 RepID=UPI00050EE72C|nr:hypothetical protein [Burkholderia pseudomallei]KGC71042.1 hypothetical protein DP57_6341 [Burkholderia pseudomallei]
MNILIAAIREARSETLRAIDRAGTTLRGDQEFGVLLGRLQECHTALQEVENQAVRIKSRHDQDAEH